MLDPWIIEEIRRREENRRNEGLPAILELPIQMPTNREKTEGNRRPPEESDGERGIAIIDFAV
jgi:hypothetical protein